MRNAFKQVSKLSAELDHVNGKVKVRACFCVSILNCIFELKTSAFWHQMCIRQHSTPPELTKFSHTLIYQEMDSVAETLAIASAAQQRQQQEQATRAQQQEMIRLSGQASSAVAGVADNRVWLLLLCNAGVLVVS